MDSASADAITENETNEEGDRKRIACWPVAEPA